MLASNMEKFAKYSPIASRLDGYAVSCLVMCAHDQAKTRKKFYGFKFIFEVQNVLLK